MLTRREYYLRDKERQLELNKIWRKNNPDKVKEYGKKWREENKERYKQTRKRWRKLNPDKVNEWKMTTYYNNREHYLKKNREAYKRNRKKILEYQKKYQKDNPGVNYAHTRATRMGLKKDKCEKCGHDGSTFRLEFHHTDYDKDEGMTLCVPCHRSEHRMQSL